MFMYLISCGMMLVLWKCLMRLSMLCLLMLCCMMVLSLMLLGKLIVCVVLMLLSMLFSVLWLLFMWWNSVGLRVFRFIVM